MRINFLNSFYHSPLADVNMISVDEAKKIVKDNVYVMPSVNVALKDAAGFVLAEDVYSAIDFPPFNQSNVDGYAIAFNDADKRLTINGLSAAGNSVDKGLQRGQAMRIFTGAPIPANADTVVMQEKVVVQNGSLIIEDNKLQQGVNFRAKGKDITKGSLALHKNDLLTAGGVGFLTSLGLTNVRVYKKPSISIIITGNELQGAGKPLQYGEVYEANSYMLKAALQQLQFDDVEVYYADDNLERLTAILNSALENADVVLLCGGISVGDYDFVLQAAANCGIKKLFHKVKQRPGKPLYFGKKETKIVFGLPGNPSSVLTCFYEYVAEALAMITMRKNFTRITYSTLQNDYTKIAGLTFFLKGLIEADNVIALDAQESYRLSSYAKANCLIKLDEERTAYKSGEKVEVHILF